ncbi:hypothetical protein [Kingella oralis]|uniref:hypothetical protein n=1 Tax=Kingella oralis TaxID=505 RepID=UPI0034E59518
MVVVFLVCGWGSLKRVFRLPLEKVKCFLLCGRHPIGFNHASRADGALPFLCFAKEKEAKERRLRLQVWLRQTSLASYDFSGGQKTRRFAAQTVLSFFPEKSRSTRLRQQERCFVVNVLDGI